MLISIMALKFESTVKIDRIRLRHHFEDNKDIKLPIYLGNETKYETEIWYVGLAYDPDFDDGIEI